MNMNPLYHLEKALPQHLRKRLKNILLLFLGFGAISMLRFIPLPLHIGSGIFFVSLSLFVCIKMLDLWFATGVLKEPTNFLAEFFFNDTNSIEAFCAHPVSSIVFKRLGFDNKELENFRRVRCGSFEGHPRILKDFLGAQFVTNKEVKAFFEKRNISKPELELALDIAERQYIEELEQAIPLYKVIQGSSFGRGLAFGEAFLLEQFELTFKGLGIDFKVVGHDKEIQSLISVLNKSREANAVLVGDDKLSIFSLLYTFGKEVGRELSIFNTTKFVSSFGDKASFESHFTHLLQEVSHAGSLILVIPDFPEFIDNTRTLGTDVVTLLDPYLASMNLQVILTSTEGSYTKHFEHDPTLLSRFQKIQCEPESGESLLSFIESRIKDLEEKNHVYFTAGSILSVRDTVMRFSSDLVIDTTDDLLLEVIADAKTKRIKCITEEMVLSRVEARTGVPQALHNEDENDKLVHLEDLLGARVIGQKEAVGAVSSALRRARSGISNTNRPIGSFLFLGPTGVGKTETTKALSDIMFSTSSPLVRFDMSEYNSSNALNRLIGTLESEGTLGNALHEHQYGVLLLDEFDKADKAVMDLFLQILDEGFFSDGQGKRVNVRNHIIIMTSNAGSDLIFNLVKDGKDISMEKDSIVKSLIAKGIFKPELLNRFDGIILFHPLTAESLRQITTLMLDSLQKRLTASGLTLTINDTLLHFLISKGHDPKFGARPLTRVIQDVIESKIAERMLRGKLRSGDTVTLTREDLV